MRNFRKFLTCAGLVLALTFPAAASPRAEVVMKRSNGAEPESLDPAISTGVPESFIQIDIFEGLVHPGPDGTLRPGVAESWQVSDDGLTYTFTLRDGLTFHDGQPVTSEDAVASIRRWGARDAMGQKLMDYTASLEAVDDKTFRLVLERSYALVLESLGKISSNVPFIMPKRLAETDPFEQVPEIIGSGPFRFVQEEWVPGSKVVYERFEDYVPRDEPPSFAAGGKVAEVDRVEWHIIPDAQTAMSALVAGEVDYYENPPPDLVPIMEQSPGVKIETLDPLGNQGMLRMNWLHPPFDNVKARQAMLYLINQEDYLRAGVGQEEYYRICYSYYACGTPLETDVGTEPLKTQDIEKAKQLFEEAGYDGRPVVILQPTDIPVTNAASLVTASLLREAGITVDLQAMDWATVTSRRAVKEPPEQGGWNIFHTWWIGGDIANPITHAGLSAACDKAWFGWPCDEEMEKLRDAFATEPDPEKRKGIAEQIQERAFEIVTHGNFGQWYNPIAYRDNLDGLIVAPVPFFWNIEKNEQG